MTVNGYCAAAKEAQPLLQRAATSAVACVSHDSPTRSGRRGGRSRRLRRRWPRPHLVDLRLRDEDRIRPTRPGPGPCTAASTPARQAPQALQKSEAGVRRHGTRAQAQSAWLELMKETVSEPLRAEAGHPRETPWPVGFRVAVTGSAAFVSQGVASESRCLESESVGIRLSAIQVISHAPSSCDRIRVNSCVTSEAFRVTVVLHRCRTATFNSHAAPPHPSHASDLRRRRSPPSWHLTSSQAACLPSRGFRRRSRHSSHPPSAKTRTCFACCQPAPT